MTQAPQILQDEWLLESITYTIDPTATYVNPIIMKGFVRDGKVYEQPRKSAILRIHQFLKVTSSGDITAILTDNKHKVLAKFRYDPAISGFENKYKQRITYNTVNSMITIRNCDLRFINKFELIHNYDKSFNSKFEVAVLDIFDCRIYQRDQVQFNFKFESSLKFIYEQNSYKQCCHTPMIDRTVYKNNGTDNLNEPDKIKEMIDDIYDDMVSL